jgi:hypothetical protein
MSRDDIAFYCRYPFHEAMVRRPFEICRDRLNLPAVMASGDEDLIEAAPGIIVTADHVPDETRQKLAAVPKIVFTRHGFSSKNYLGWILERCDIVCVSSQWVKSDLQKRYPNASPEYWVTGFTALDGMWARLQQRNETKATTLLYAPSWNEGLTAHEVIGTSWAKDWLAGGNRRLLVKLHPHTDGASLRDWLKTAGSSPEQIELLNPDSDVYSIMPEADMLMTDISSTMFYWLALNRPVVLVDPIADKDHPFFDPKGYEWTWRDMGHRAGNAQEVLRALADSELHPNRHARQRRLYRSRVFGQRFDGKASERLAAKIAELAGKLRATPAP